MLKLQPRIPNIFKTKFVFKSTISNEIAVWKQSVHLLLRFRLHRFGIKRGYTDLFLLYTPTLMLSSLLQTHAFTWKNFILQLFHLCPFQLPWTKETLCWQTWHVMVMMIVQMGQTITRVSLYSFHCLRLVHAQFCSCKSIRVLILWESSFIETVKCWWLIWLWFELESVALFTPYTGCKTL